MHKQPGIEIHFACQGYSTFYIEDQSYSHNKWSLIMFDASTPHRVIRWALRPGGGPICPRWENRKHVAGDAGPGGTEEEFPY